jgi:hypothetical protein
MQNAEFRKIFSLRSKIIFIKMLFELAKKDGNGAKAEP